MYTLITDPRTSFSDRQCEHVYVIIVKQITPFTQIILVITKQVPFTSATVISNKYCTRVKLLPWESSESRDDAVHRDAVTNSTRVERKHIFPHFHEFTITDLRQIICNTTTHLREEKRIANMSIYLTSPTHVLTFFMCRPHTRYGWQSIKVIHEDFHNHYKKHSPLTFNKIIQSLTRKIFNVANLKSTKENNVRSNFEYFSYIAFFEKFVWKFLKVFAVLENDAAIYMNRLVLFVRYM